MSVLQKLFVSVVQGLVMALCPATWPLTALVALAGGLLLGVPDMLVHVLASAAVVCLGFAGVKLIELNEMSQTEAVRQVV